MITTVAPVSQAVSSPAPDDGDDGGPYNESIAGDLDFFAVGASLPEIHYTALVTLCCSSIVSVGVLVYLLGCSKTKLEKRILGERLVVYLAICDLIFSVSHLLDHGYMTATKHHPPDALCRVFAMILVTFMFTQSIIVTGIAANAFYMVVKEKRFQLGSRDWRLLVPALGVPLLFSIGAGIPGLLGASSGWCVVNINHPYSRVASVFIGSTLFACMVANMLFYSLVWGKLKKVNGVAGRNGKYDSLAKALLVFVAVYILQYLPGVIINVWYLIGQPPVSCIVITVFFTNLGGVFNFIAYTLLRQSLVRPQNAPAQNNGT